MYLLYKSNPTDRILSWDVHTELLLWAAVRAVEVREIPGSMVL